MRRHGGRATYYYCEKCGIGWRGRAYELDKKPHQCAHCLSYCPETDEAKIRRLHEKQSEEKSKLTNWQQWAKGR